MNLQNVTIVLEHVHIYLWILRLTASALAGYSFSPSGVWVCVCLRRPAARCYSGGPPGVLNSSLLQWDPSPQPLIPIRKD